MADYHIARSDDFHQVYDLDDPAPYYAPLAEADYRMPAELVGWLRRAAPWLRNQLGVHDRPLSVLDFACGYGFVGALLRHRVDAAEVYAHYASRPWTPADGRVNWSADAAWFAARRLETADGASGGLAGAGWSLTGVDLAANAVAYAEAVGLIDQGFTDNIPADGVGAELANHLATVDVVIESGAIGGIYRECFGPIVDAAGGGDRPWFVYCPRPSVKLDSLDELWAELGYDVTRQTSPVRYRKPIGPDERSELLAQTTAAGNDPEAAFLDDYLAVEVRLARPSLRRADQPGR